MEECREFPESSFAPKSNYCSYKRFLWLKWTCPECVFPQKKCDVGAKRCKTRSILSGITVCCQVFRYGCHSNKMLTSFSSCIQHLSIRNVCGAAILSHLSDESRILGNSLGKSPSIQRSAPGGKFAKFSKPNMSDECGWRLGRIADSFPCKPCKTQLTGGASAFLPTISLREVWIYFRAPLRQPTHTRFPSRVSGDIVFPRDLCVLGHLYLSCWKSQIKCAVSARCCLPDGSGL